MPAIPVPLYEGRAADPGKRPIALVLAGGNALGAYQAGACEVLHRQGVLPDWVVGSSVGAVNAAIIAGNRPQDRIAKLRQFWEAARQIDYWFTPPAGLWRQFANSMSAVRSLLFGRPSLYQHRLPGVLSMLLGMPGDVALYDQSPLEATLRAVIDFARLNSGEVRLTVAALDMETGEEVYFDTTRDRIEPVHLRASSAFVPVFSPVEIDGRCLCDIGGSSNLPLDPVLGAWPGRDLLCFAIDLFDLRGERPHSLDAAMARAQDLMFAGQSRRAIAAWQTEYRLRAAIRSLADRLPPQAHSDPAIAAAAAEGRAAAVTLVHLACHALPDELSSKMFAFSTTALRDRWAAGIRDMITGLKLLAAPPPRRPGLTVVSVPAAVAAEADAAARNRVAGPGNARRLPVPWPVRG